MDPMRILPTLVETVAGLDDAVLQVNCHRDVLDADGARRDAELADWLRDEAAAGRLELAVHDYFSDEDLWSYLASLDLSVLPYTSAPTRAGSRRAATCRRRCSPRAAATTPTRGRS